MTVTMLSDYSISVLSHPKRFSWKIEKGPHRNKPSSYSTVLPHIKELWSISSFSCGKRLVPFLPELIKVLERHKEISLSPGQKKLLLTISSATFDRLLKPERERLTIKGRRGTKPGTLLKRQIPIRISTPLDEQKPGLLEIDLVALCGGSLRGDYVNVFNSTDIATCWNECQGFLGKTESATFHALKTAEGRIPFLLAGIDSDNDSIFINDHLFRYCKQNKIIFTRCRPYRKNDQAHVEQKNWSVIRQWFGYKRFKTKKALDIINQMCELLSLYQNFFQPAMKLAIKQRVGAKIKRIYDKSQTPYQRVMNHPDIPRIVKLKLIAKYRQANPVKILRELNHLREKLEKCH
jgi:hypothetical protein